MRLFYHFKILYDQTWNYKKICEKLILKDYPFLCVLEHIKQPNTHIHFRESFRINENSMKQKLKRLAGKHHLRKHSPQCLPTSMKCRPPYVKGFQNMCKERTSRRCARTLWCMCKR